jgi:hypothetical protein
MRAAPTICPAQANVLCTVWVLEAPLLDLTSDLPHIFFQAATISIDCLVVVSKEALN